MRKMEAMQSIIEFGESRMSSLTPIDHRFLIGVVADEITVVGFLLAGIGDSNIVKNFIIIDPETNFQALEQSIMALYNRKNMGVLIVAQEVFIVLPGIQSRLQKMLPIVVKIPTRNIFTEKTLIKYGIGGRNKKQEKLK